MSFPAVIDTSAFIWDREEFNRNAAPFYSLADHLVNFMETFENEKPNVFLRSDLLVEMINGFPCEMIDGIPNFRELNSSVYSFLSKLGDGASDFDATLREGIMSTPNIIYTYYSDPVKQEIGYLISAMHDNDTGIIYFTFKTLWEDEKTKLTTRHLQTTKIYNTFVYNTNSQLVEFLSQFKPAFDHNGKHDRNKGWHFDGDELVAPLSCFDGNSNNIPQGILSKAILSKITNQLYGYDEKNQIFVRFLNHQANKYHGHDVKIEDAPSDIKKYFHKK